MSLVALLVAGSLGGLSGPEAAERLTERAWQEAAPIQANATDASVERDTKADIELGKKYAADVDKELKASTNKEKTERLQRIATQMAEIANRTHAEAKWGDKRFFKFPYTFKLVEGKDVNAFSIPGGFIYVYEGLMDQAQSDDEIAGVIAHEIAHASLRHIATLQREQSKMQTIQIPLILAAILTGGSGAAINMIQATQLVGAAFTSGWSVKAEQASDYAGFQYMMRSPYNPSGLLTFMERLAMEEKRRPQIDWGIYRTHPPGQERARALNEMFARAKIPLQRSVVTTSFRATSKPLDNGTIELRFGKTFLGSLAGADASERAERAVKRLNAFFDSEPDRYLLTTRGTEILGRRQVLLEITAEDALANNVTATALRDAVVKNISTALFDLTFQTYDLK